MICFLRISLACLYMIISKSDFVVGSKQGESLSRDDVVSRHFQLWSDPENDLEVDDEEALFRPAMTQTDLITSTAIVRTRRSGVWSLWVWLMFFVSCSVLNSSCRVLHRDTKDSRSCS